MASCLGKGKMLLAAAVVVLSVMCSSAVSAADGVWLSLLRATVMT